MTQIPTQYLTLPEGNLAYTDYGGNGDLVLMLPGMGALRSEYRFLAPALKEAGFRPVAVDLRGHGESSVPWPVYDVPSVGQDILALIDHFNTGAAHIIATSFSPGAAVWAAAEAPQQILSLTLIGAFVRDTHPNPIMKALMWLVMNNPWRVQAWRMVYNSMYPTRKPADFEDYLAELTDNLRQPGRFAACKALGDSSRQPSEDRLTQVSARTLVIMGTKDPDFPNPVDEAQFIATQTGAQLALIDGAGHYPQTEMPEQVSPLIVDFLRQSVPAGG